MAIGSTCLTWFFKGTVFRIDENWITFVSDIEKRDDFFHEKSIQFFHRDLSNRSLVLELVLAVSALFEFDEFVDSSVSFFQKN